MLSNLPTLPDNRSAFGYEGSWIKFCIRGLTVFGSSLRHLSSQGTLKSGKAEEGQEGGAKKGEEKEKGTLKKERGKEEENKRKRIRKRNRIGRERRMEEEKMKKRIGKRKNRIQKRREKRRKSAEIG